MIIYIYYYYQSTRVCIRNMHTMHSSQSTPTRSSQYACTYSYYQWSSTNSQQYVYARSMIILLLILYTHAYLGVCNYVLYTSLHDVLVCILLWTYTLYIYINVCTSLYYLGCVLSSYRIHTITTSQTCTMQPNFVPFDKYSMHILIAIST